VETQGRVALVTGAGRRVGRALALALASRGMRVAVHYHASATEAAETARQAEALGAEACTVRADLRRAESAERLVRDVVDHFGTLDVLVNSAAIMLRTPLDEITIEQWDETFAINLRAPFFCARAAAQVMRERGGIIINIADLAGLETWPAYIPHGIAKAGVIHMTRSLARALAPAVRVNAVAPGTVLLPESWSAADGERLARTTPLRRLGSPEDVGRRPSCT
jgi:pteridine reductase